MDEIKCFFWTANWQGKGNPLLKNITVLGHEHLSRSYCHPEADSHKLSSLIILYTQKVNPNECVGWFNLVCITASKHGIIAHVTWRFCVLFYLVHNSDNCKSSTRWWGRGLQQETWRMSVVKREWKKASKSSQGCLQVEVDQQLLCVTTKRLGNWDAFTGWRNFSTPKCNVA